ncbi:MAG: rod shape-determining protein RodA [Lachnospiraceae bacterium]|nr:rod shape-determining protein RodA [Lachnospiraceae bacterium]
MIFNIKQYNYKKLDITLILVVAVLVSVGTYLINIVDNTLTTKQILGVILGIAVCATVALIDYHTICNMSMILYAIGIILLILVHIPGIGVTVYGATRWLDFKIIQIQPSELCKVIMIVAMAYYFTIFRDTINTGKTLIIGIVIMAIPILLIFNQPDLSSSLVLVFFFVMMLYGAGLSYRIIVPCLIVGVPLIISAVWYVCQPYQVLLDDYQQKRILGLLHPEDYPDLMFQQNKSVNIIGKGKLYGLFNGGAPEDLNCLSMPIVESDFIFSAVGEAFGFIGAGLIIVLLLVLVFRCLKTAKKAKDYTGKLICIGVSAMFMFQVFANIGVVTRILPNTGLPLPFLSYGLSALLSYMAALGLVLNIGLQGNMKARG